MNFAARSEANALRLKSVMPKLFAKPRPLRLQCFRCQKFLGDMVSLMYHTMASRCPTEGERREQMWMSVVPTAFLCKRADAEMK
jgi:hypothetical protein